MGVGIGGSGSHNSSVQGAPGVDYANSLQARSGALQDESMGQILELLRTGGIGAQMPLIQSSVAQQQNALNNALGAQRATNTRYGTGGTPLAEGQMGATKLLGMQNIADTPGRIAQPLLNQAPQVSNQLIQSIIGALQNYGKSKGNSFGFNLGVSGGSGG